MLKRCVLAVRNEHVPSRNRFYLFIKIETLSLFPSLLFFYNTLPLYIAVCLVAISGGCERASAACPHSVRTLNPPRYTPTPILPRQSQHSAQTWSQIGTSQMPNPIK